MMAPCRRMISASLVATAIVVWALAAVSLHGQAPARPDTGTAQPAKPAEPAQPKNDEPPKPQLLRSTWFLLSHEAKKFGYLNKALYRVAGRGPVTYRLEIHRFLKVMATDKRPMYLETTSLEMDKDWTAIGFRTASNGVGVDATVTEGKIADGKLTVTETSGPRASTSTVKVEGTETFAGAFLDWLGSQEMAAGRTFVRRTIDEQNGLLTKSPRMARVLRLSTIKTLTGPEEGFVVVEQEGGQVTGHLMRRNGLLVRSEGQNHNRVAQEVAASQGARLDLTGQVTWENRIQGKTGNALTSETFGYTVMLPSYPYLPTVAADGQFVAADNVTGRDGLHLVVKKVRAGNAATARRLYEDWIHLVGPAEEVVETRRPVAGHPACIFRGKTTVDGRAATFQLATVVREHLGYLIGYIHVGAKGAGDAAVFRRFLGRLEWTRIFGRERGHWDIQDYVSDSYGYRLRLLAPGWRLPEDREGVATSIEVVREDRSAMLVVIHEPVDGNATLEETAAAYERRVSTNVPGANSLKQQRATLDGRPAVLLSYDAKAIDDEPTESRHIIAIENGRLTILTFVSKKASLEANLKHFTAAVKSFRFGKPAEDKPAPSEPGTDK